MNDLEKDMEITLPLLQSIEQDCAITQRSLSKSLGLALGLTNLYLKRCINKGLVKIEQIPANRYLYYLTPQGFTEKSRLTAQYLTRSFNFYREASDDCAACFQHCSALGWRRVILCGVSDLAEIAILQAQQTSIEIMGIFDRQFAADSFMNLRVWHDENSMPEVDAFIITQFEDQSELVRGLTDKMAVERILAPNILGL